MIVLPRRTFLFALLATPAAQAGTYGRVMAAGRPKLVKGHPDRVDFGHGLLVPMNHEAFETLWEGDDRWIAYGHGFGQTEAAAMGAAEEAAVATMKLFLITEAFAPERLVRVEGGGWRLKSHDTRDLVQGDVDLPGRPVMPTVDRGNADDPGDGDDVASAAERVHATTGWVVWKSDVTLDAVRAKARLVGLGG